MKHRTTHYRFGFLPGAGRLAAVCLAVALLPAATSPAEANGGSRSVGIFPAGASPYYQSYGAWAAKWWQWALSMPASQHPLTDTADLSEGQSGPVWFLGGSFTGNSTVVRHGTVPFGVALFIPILNVDCSTLEAPPFHGDTEQQLCDCAQSFLQPTMEDPAENLFLIVDGVPVRRLERFRSKSTLFAWSLLDDDVMGLAQPAETLGNGVADGVHVMLWPLLPGPHTIRFGGTFPDFNFSLDITYDIVVKK